MLILARRAAMFSAFGLACFALACPAVADQPLAGGHPPAAADVKSGQKPDASKPDASKPDAGKPDAGKRAKSKKHAKRQAGNAKAKAAQKRSADRKEEKRAKSIETADADREEAALTLVREHHPDLVELLQRLKETKPRQYQKAIQELYRENQRLEVARQRDPVRYKLDLQAWQLDSRIRLLTAKLSIADRAELREDLRAALVQRAFVRVEQKEWERQRLTARLKKLDEEIKNSRGDSVQRSFDRLLRAAEKARPRGEAE